MNDPTNWQPLPSATSLEDLALNQAQIIDRQLREREHRMQMQKDLARNTELSREAAASAKKASETSARIEEQTKDLVSLANEARAFVSLGERLVKPAKIAATCIALYAATLGGCSAYNAYKASQIDGIVVAPEAEQ